MMHSALHDLELSDNMQTLYKILLTTHPDNPEIQKELGKLTNNKDTYIRQIIDIWNSRAQATYTEIQIKRLCSAYYANENENSVVDTLQGREKCKMESRSWIVKTDSMWRGWSPEDSQYFEAPILFEGEIKFDRYYEQLVVSDKDSGSVNLIWTIKKLSKGDRTVVCPMKTGSVCGYSSVGNICQPATQLYPDTVTIWRLYL